MYYTVTHLLLYCYFYIISCMYHPWIISDSVEFISNVPGPCSALVLTHFIEELEEILTKIKEYIIG